MLQIAIRLYWRVTPAHRRRTCLFEESCSRCVMRVARSDGTLAALVALGQRLRQCRPGYAFEDAGGMPVIRFADGSFMPLDAVSAAVKQEAGVTQVAQMIERRF